MIRVALMSASAIHRESIATHLQAQPDIAVAGAAASLPMARSLLKETAVDVVVMDLSSMPAAADWVDEISGMVSVVVLSPDPETALFDRISSCASGAVLLSDAFPEQISCAIRCVAAGLLVFDNMAMPARPRAELPEDLTPRELDVLKLLAEGFPNREIAQRLGISEHTIKFHISSILGKFGASSRTEAVSRGIRSGLIEI